MTTFRLEKQSPGETSTRFHVLDNADAIAASSPWRTKRPATSKSIGKTYRRLRRGTLPTP